MEQDAEFIRRRKKMWTVEIIILQRRIHSGIGQMIFVGMEKEFSEAVMQRLDTIKRFPPACGCHLENTIKRFPPVRKLNRTYENTEISTGRSTQS